MAKFEPQNTSDHAKMMLQSIKQGTRDFATFKSEFEQWAFCTGWSDADLYDRMKVAMSETYITRMSYFQPPAKTYDVLKQYGILIDTQLVDLKHNLAVASGKAPVVPGTSRPTGFRNPNAMDIDATVTTALEINATFIDKVFAGVTDKNAIKDLWKKVLKGRCRSCGSKQHTDAHTNHGTQTCNHCSKTGHWGNICLHRILGEPKSSTTRASPSSTIASTSSTGDDKEASIGALKDILVLQQKQLNKTTAALSKLF